MQQHRCSSSNTHTKASHQAGQTNMAEQRPHCAPALHLVCRRFLIRINCLARLPVRPKLDSLSCLLCLWFLFTFPAQSPLASGCFLSGRAFYILPPASVTSVQTCGWDTALLAFPSPVTPIQHSAARDFVDHACGERPLSWFFRPEGRAKFFSLCILTIPSDVGDKP